MKNDQEIQNELQSHERISRASLACQACGYHGIMGMLHAKKAPMLLVGERILYAGIALFFFASYFAENETVAYTIRMVIPALVFVIFIYTEQKLKTHTYACPNCSATIITRGAR